jgi:hypothetical protein
MGEAETRLTRLTLMFFFRSVQQFNEDSSGKYGDG